VGERLAIGMNSLSYHSRAEPFTGPTLKRCGVQTVISEQKHKEVHRNVLDIEFDVDLLRGDAIEFTQDTRLGENAGSVALNSIGLCFGSEAICGCMQWILPKGGVEGEWACAVHATHITGLENKDSLRPTKYGNGPTIQRRTEFPNALLGKHWIVAVVDPKGVGRTGISIDLDASIEAHLDLAGTASGWSDELGHVAVSELRAVRYAWGLGVADDTCCPALSVAQGLGPCAPNNCPLRTRGNKLPGNPFFAMVDSVTRACKCPSPQVCS
jgi:hypothetical protein